ncbi:MAG: TIGR04002 family protein [Firmicutes bacterium]|nr:TIGR04002 family protein [Bacillota bacterium]
MKQDRSITLVALTGVFAALITLFTAFFIHIPIGVNGGYLHFGDAVIYLAASLLPLPYAVAAAAIGGGLADLLTAPMWAIATVIVKSLIVLPFTSSHERMLCRRNYAAPVFALFITCLGYYAAEAILFGSVPALIASVTGNLVQAIGSACFYFVLAYAFDKAGLKRRLFQQE